MKIFAVTAALLVCMASLRGQVKFMLQGQIDFPANGKIYLTSSGYDKEYYAGRETLDSAEVKDSKFLLYITAPDSSTYAYRLVMPAYGQTGMTLIGPKDKNILIEAFDDYNAPSIEGSAAEYEMKHEYELSFKTIIERTRRLNAYEDSLYDSYGKHIPESLSEDCQLSEKKIVDDADSLLYGYVLHHNGSAVSCWKLIERFNSFGYKDIYWASFQHLSPSVRKSLTGNVLRSALLTARITGIGRKFPSLELQDIAGKKGRLKIDSMHAKVYLVDFWFQSCSPCLRDMAIYKQLYDQYRYVGLEIIGISTDMTADKQKWKNRVISNNIMWKNFLDENGVLAKKMNITRFPTTFLLDSSGHIIKRDISTSELKNDLNNNINLFDKQSINAREPS